MGHRHDFRGLRRAALSALVVMLFLATLGLAACGDDDDGASATASDTTAVTPSDADTDATAADEQATAESADQAAVAEQAAPTAGDDDQAVAAAEEHTHGDGGQIALTMAATDLVDSAGFHAMQEELEASGSINDRWAGTVADVQTAMQSVPWDPSLAHGVEELEAALEEFHAGLLAGDAEAALAGAVAVHEAQHHFSPAVYAWLSEQRPGHDDASVLVTSLAAIDIVDSAGFHGMGDSISEAGEISGRNASTVGNVLVVVNAARWPEDASAGAEALATALGETATQMELGDIDATLEGLHAIHEAQHELSHGFYAWLAENPDVLVDADAQVAHAYVLKAVDLVNSLGLHGMATDLDEAETINDRYVGQVEKLAAVLAGAPYVDGMGEAGMEMHARLVALFDALAADDLEAARVTAHAAHDAQHELSHTAFAWLADNAALGGGTVAAHEDDGHAHEADNGIDMDAARALEVVATEFAFEPGEIHASVGETVKILFHNEGAVLHDITTAAFAGAVMTEGSAEHADSASHSHDDGVTFHVAADTGGEAVLYFTATEPGEYDLLCSVPGHEELGMTARLVVDP